MAALPEPTKSTAKRIHTLYEERKEDPRPHLGCSIIGHSCDRYIWLSWRWALEEAFPGRIKRVFDTGKREEDRLVQDLRAIDVELHTIDPETKKQISVSAHNGHLSGSVDGIGRGFVEAPKSWAVLECKTHNNKSFTELQKKGVKEAKPQHYAQMQMYMGLLDIDRAMYLAQNKDSDDLYSEWVHFDRDTFDRFMSRAKRIIDATLMPEGVSSDPSWFECKWCGFYELCHGEKVAQPNCRTCCHSSPVENAKWSCNAKSKEITFREQLAGCDSHLYLPGLIPFASAQDGSETHIAYVTKDGKQFVNGTGAGQFKSREIYATPIELLGDKVLEQIKTVFDDAEVVSPLAAMKDDLVEVYRDDDKTVKGKKFKEQLKANKQTIDYLKATGK